MGIRVKHEIFQGREWEWERSHGNRREWVHISHSRTSLVVEVCSTFSYVVRIHNYRPPNLPNLCIFDFFSYTKRLKSTFRDQPTAQSQRYSAECFRLFHLLVESPKGCLLRRVALRSAPVTCATAVAHSLMQRLRQRARSKFSWITKNVAPVYLVTWYNDVMLQFNMADDTMFEWDNECHRFCGDW